MKLIQVGTVLATGALAVAGSHAYTAAISSIPASKIIGAASTTITGAASTAPVYTYDTGKTHITSITFTLTGDTHASTVTVTPWKDTDANGVGDAFGTAVTCSYAANGSDSDYTCTTTGTPADWLISTLYRTDFAVV
jgi:hypothetical protein